MTTKLTFKEFLEEGKKEKRGIPSGQPVKLLKTGRTYLVTGSFGLENIKDGKRIVKSMDKLEVVSDDEKKGPIVRVNGKLYAADRSAIRANTKKQDNL